MTKNSTSEEWTDLGSPYKTRIAVTSHRRVSFCGWVLISSNLCPPILGLLSIWEAKPQRVKKNHLLDNLAPKSRFRLRGCTYTAHSLLLRQTQASCFRHVVRTLQKCRWSLTFAMITRRFALTNQLNTRTHFALSFHCLVEGLPFNQEHGYLLVEFHVHPFVVVSDGVVQGLAFTGVHDRRIQAFHAQTPAVSQRHILCVPWLQNLHKKVLWLERRFSQGN